MMNQCQGGVSKVALASVSHKSHSLVLLAYSWCFRNSFVLCSSPLLSSIRFVKRFKLSNELSLPKQVSFQFALDPGQFPLPVFATICLILSLVTERNLPCRPVILPLGVFVIVPPIVVLLLKVNQSLPFLASCALTTIYVVCVTVSSSIGYKKKPKPNVYMAQTVVYIWTEFALCCSIYGMYIFWDKDIKLKKLMPEVMLFILGASNVVLYVAAFRGHYEKFFNVTKYVSLLSVIIVVAGFFPIFQNVYLVEMLGFFQIVAVSIMQHCLKRIKANEEGEEGQAQEMESRVPGERDALIQQSQVTNPTTTTAPSSGLTVDCPPEYPGAPGTVEAPSANMTNYSNETPPTYNQAVEQAENVDDYAPSEISEAPSYASTLPPGHLRIQGNRNFTRRFP